MPDLTAGGVRIHYASAPSVPRHPAIVFLHGAGANHSIWLGQLKALKDRAWVVLPDLPGHGRSQEVPGVTIEEYANALVPFLEALRDVLPPTEGLDVRVAENPPRRTGRAEESAYEHAPGRLVLAGHSMGGAIALTIALSRPDLLSGLVLVGTGARLTVAQEILEGLKTAPAETQALIARWSFTPEADANLIMRTMRELAGVKPGRTLSDFQACNAFDVRERIDRITVPTLILCGSEDRMTPPRYASYLAERIPGSTLRIIERMGHGAMIEDSDTVSAEIGRFLDAVG